MNKKFGFTLAEVLITLAIIGVVAALTLPTLVQNYKDKENIVKLEKTYAVLYQAVKMALAQSPSAGDWGIGTTMSAEQAASGNAQQLLNYDMIVHQLTTSRDCGYMPGCFTSDYKMLNGSRARDFENLNYYRKFFLNNGVLIAMQSYSTKSTSGEIWIDVNGNKGPNTIGKDTFLFSIDKNGTVLPYNIDTLKKGTMGSCSTNDSGNACAGWVLEFKNFDYIKCKGLSWNGKHTCK